MTPFRARSTRRIVDDPRCPPIAHARRGPRHARPARRRHRTEAAQALHADPGLRAHGRVRAALHGAREGLVPRGRTRREDRARPVLRRHRQAHRGRPGPGRYVRHRRAHCRAGEHRRGGEGDPALVRPAAARGPRGLKRFLRATLKGADYAFRGKHFDEGVGDVLKHHPEVDPEGAIGAAQVAARFVYAEEVTSGKVAVGRFEPGRLEKTRDTYTQYLELKRKVPLEEIYTNDLLPEKK